MEFISSADGNSIQVNDDADGDNEGYLLNKTTAGSSGTFKFNCDNT